MTTRRAKDSSVFHQARYASSPAFDHGLSSYMVARRCSILDRKEDRDLVWWLQFVSTSAGGMAALARELISKYADRLQTPAMARIRMRPGKVCSAEEVRKIRKDLPYDEESQFELKGDQSANSFLSEVLSQPDDQEEDERKSCYLADDFLKLCRDRAESGLEKYLLELCVNPETSLDSGTWFFPTLADALREHKAAIIKTKIAGAFETELGKRVFDVLDYTVYCRGLTLIQGEARLGKSHAGRAWCEQHPGNARFVEVPSGNDDVTFFRDLARGLGLGNFLNYKVVQIRERVEAVLRSGDITLVLDEAQRLWPQTNFREGYPKRIVWVMTMANDGVPICMISTPQFFVTQKVVEKNGWNSAQLIGRICHYESLPQALSEADLMGVAKAVFPEADGKVLRALADYARLSARYLAAIDAIAKRARFVAQRAGRLDASADDVRTAMLESVIPADTKLNCTLESVSNRGSGRRRLELDAQPEPDLPVAIEPRILPAPRLAPIAEMSPRRAGNLASLTEA